MKFHPSDYLDSKETSHWQIFAEKSLIWEALPEIASYFKKEFKPNFHTYSSLPGHFLSDQIYIGKGVKIAPNAIIEGPAWIGDYSEIRAGAFIRENVIVGSHCVLGNSCEFKNSILFNNCKVPHFAYVGDSILGAGAHLGAGVICSNFKLDGGLISIKDEGKVYATGLRKFGAILGDHAEVGSNAVLNPGSIIGRKSLIYPGTQWRGVLPEKSMVKATVSYRISPRRD